MASRIIAPVVLCFCFANGAGASIEIWLARSSQCNSCEIFRQAAENRQYGEALRYDDNGKELIIPIKTVAKESLDKDLLNQLPEKVWQNSDWELALTVLVVDQGHVLGFGNIADSADNRNLRHSESVMFPPDTPEDDNPALLRQNIYTPFFVKNWNLEYFAELALGQRSPRQSVPMVDLKSPNPVSLRPTNVIIWGSAGTPLGSSLFIPTRISEIRSLLESLDIEGINYITLYGHGPDVPGNDTSYMVDGKTRFKRADLPVDMAADAESLNRVFTGILDNESSRSLLIQVGHSGPAGSPLWGSGLTLLPSDLAPLDDKSVSALVLVSGACHGGMFARVGQCGFFAAHPDVIATGCQLSPEALETSDDYLRYFFQAATDANMPNSAMSNTSSRKMPTLSAAHWYATTHLEDHQISYSTTDAIIDEYFSSHPERLPASMTVREILASADVLTEDERRALEKLTSDLPKDLDIPLTGYIELHHEAQEKLADERELASAARNKMTNMPYMLALPQMARRLAYRSLDVPDGEFLAASVCEQQSIPEILGVMSGQ